MRFSCAVVLREEAQNENLLISMMIKSPIYVFRLLRFIGWLFKAFAASKFASNKVANECYLKVFLEKVLIKINHMMFLHLGPFSWSLFFRLIEL